MIPRSLQKLDEDLLISIHKLRRRPFTWVMIFFTWTGMGKFWVTVAFSLNILNRFRPTFPQEFLNAFYTPLLVWAINWVLKRAFSRDRPCTRRKDILPLCKIPPCDSFPSSHAGSTFGFFFTLLWWDFPGVEWIGVWAAIVSFSRMYLGVHYLTDIIGGMMVGVLSSRLIYLIF